MQNLAAAAQQQANNDNEMRRQLLSSDVQATIGDANMPGEGLDVDSEIMLGAVGVPDDNCCWLYDEEDFVGDTFWVCHDGHTKFIDLSSWWNDRAESYVCGRDITVEWCDNDWSNCHNRGSSSGRINNPNIGNYLGNGLTTVKVSPYDSRNHGAANLFSDYNCEGRAAAFAHLGLESKTKYNTGDLEFMGIHDNSLSSVRVAAGYALELYRDNSQANLIKTIVGSQDYDGEMPCHTLYDDNDTVSSIVVRPILMGASVGYWKGITAT